MLKVGLVGMGFMGRGHLEQYERLMAEGAGVRLVALCDVDPKRFGAGPSAAGNLGDLGKGGADFSKYALYGNFDDMIASESLDYVDITLPTYLHAYYAARAMRKGLHVLCEKPMALDPGQCEAMIRASRETGKTLMIAQCLRFWPAYERLKRAVDSDEFGEPIDLYLVRSGGGAPMWSHQDWLLDERLGGGCLLDQHVHDVDILNDLFGLPEAVSSLGRNVNPGAGFDAISTHYRYPGFIATAQDDWSHFAPFSMGYRAHFAGGSLVFENGVVTAYPKGGEAYVAEDSSEAGYYFEIKYFVERLTAGAPVLRCAPESTRDSIRIAAAERESALARGEWKPIA